VAQIKEKRLTQGRRLKILCRGHFLFFVCSPVLLAVLMSAWRLSAPPPGLTSGFVDVIREIESKCYWDAARSIQPMLYLNGGGHIEQTIRGLMSAYGISRWDDERRITQQQEALDAARVVAETLIIEEQYHLAAFFQSIIYEITADPFSLTNLRLTEEKIWAANEKYGKCQIKKSWIKRNDLSNSS